MIDKLKNLFSGRAPAGKVEYIVAGLGNPGKKYEKTRHNAGFMAVDYISGKLGFAVDKVKFGALCGDCEISGKRVLFIKPTTYMNNSGESVRSALAFYKVPIENLIAISDDVALKPGIMRVRRGGSDGGQKGLRSIIQHTGEDSFPRIRIGVGPKPHPEMELADWVLSRFTDADMKVLTPVLENALTAVELITAGNIDSAMNKFN